MASVGFLLGCEDSASRLFAVTFSDSVTLECQAVVLDEFLSDETSLKQATKDAEEAYEVLRTTYPPITLGRHLRVNEVDGRMSAWFEEPANELHYDTFGSQSVVFHYEGPAAVFRGEIAEGTIEGSYEAIVNTDVEDKGADRILCGNRLVRTGVLSLTDTSSVQGRVRWTERAWQDQAATACAAYVDCARDWLLEGMEVPY